MPAFDDENKRMIKYLKALDFLNKKEASAVRSILTMVSRVLVNMDDKRLKTYHELAEKMLDYSIYVNVIEFADELIQDSNAKTTFIKMCREGSADPKEAIVMDYQEEMPEESVFTQKATLNDMINFFRRLKPERNIRYMIVVDEVDKSLIGIISVNDFTRNRDLIMTSDRDCPVVELPFFNSNPKVILDTDKMEMVSNLFYEAQQAGKKITKLLVVNNNRKPVGYVGEPELARWEATIMG